MRRADILPPGQDVQGRILPQFLCGFGNGLESFGQSQQAEGNFAVLAVFQVDVHRDAGGLRLGLHALFVGFLPLLFRHNKSLGSFAFGAHRPDRLPRRARQAGHKSQDQQARGNHAPLVAADEFPHPVARGRRMRLDRFPREIPLHVGGETVGRFIAPRPILLQRLHHDPVEFVAKQAGQLLRFRAAVR